MDDLDRLLMEQAEEYVKTDKANEAARITPWESSISSILWGFLLISFHVNFFGFPPEFLISALGFLLILRGFGRIAHLSLPLRAGFYLALVSAVWFETNTILECTPLVMPQAYRIASFVFFTAARLLLFYLLYRGLPAFICNEEQRKAAAEKLKDNLTYLIVTYPVVIIAIFLSGSLFVWILLIFYLVLLYHILKGLDEVREILRDYSYDLQPAGGLSAVSIRTLTAVLVLGMALGMPAAMHLSGKPQNVQPIREDVLDGSDRIFYGADLMAMLTQMDGLPEEWIHDSLDRFFADPNAEIAGMTPAPIDEETVSAIREQMVRAGVAETVAYSLPASEILRYEGFDAVYPEENPEAANERNPELITYAYLFHIPETDTWRTLFYGHYQEKPRGSYTDAVRLYLTESACRFADFTGGTIGESEDGLYCRQITCPTFYTWSNTEFLLTLPVPDRGDRYDFYLGFQVSDRYYLDQLKETDAEEPRYFSPHSALNLYHRKKLWCYPYLSPETALGFGSRDLFSQLFSGKGSQVYEYACYRSFSFSVPLEP